MKLGMFLLILHDVIEDLVSEGILSTDGEFTSPDLVEDVKFAGLIENRLKQHGIEVQQDVDRVINALPLFVAMVKR